MKIGIIGGGAAGLAAAFQLTRQGHVADVFEQAPFLGGQASTFLVGGTPVERGYHHLFKSDYAMVKLIDQLGLTDSLSWFNSNSGYFHEGHIWKFTTPLDLLKFQPLSFSDRIRLGLMTLYLQKRKEWRSLETQTASEWIRKNAGENIYKVIFEPMLRGKFGKYFDEVSMAWLWNKFALRTTSRGKGIKGMFTEQLGYPIGSFEIIFDSLNQEISSTGGKVFTDARVEKVIIEDNKAKGLFARIGGKDIYEDDYDAVIATVPSYVFNNLIPELPHDYRNQLGKATYLAAVLAVLVLDRQLTSTYWMYVGDRTMPFLGVIEHTNMVSHEHYGGNHIIYLGNYLDQDDPAYGLSETELLDFYLPSLKRLNPDFNASWIKEYHYHREQAAQPVVTRAYSDQIPSHRTPIAGLYLANTTQIYPEDRGTNYSVRLGNQVADQVVKEIGQTFIGSDG